VSLPGVHLQAGVGGRAEGRCTPRGAAFIDNRGSSTVDQRPACGLQRGSRRRGSRPRGRPEPPRRARDKPRCHLFRSRWGAVSQAPAVHVVADCLGTRRALLMEYSSPGIYDHSSRPVHSPSKCGRSQLKPAHRSSPHRQRPQPQRQRHGSQPPEAWRVSFHCYEYTRAIG